MYFLYYAYYLWIKWLNSYNLTCLLQKKKYWSDIGAIKWFCRFTYHVQRESKKLHCKLSQTIIAVKFLRHRQNSNVLKTSHRIHRVHLLPHSVIFKPYFTYTQISQVKQAKWCQVSGTYESYPFYQTDRDKRTNHFWKTQMGKLWYLKRLYTYIQQSLYTHEITINPNQA